MQFLIQGDRGIWVEYLQLALTRAGYPTRIDGIFGEHTCQALKDFTGNTDVCTVNRAVWEQLKPYLTGYRMHTIEKGDTVFGLSRRYGTTEEAILVANPLIDPDDLVVDAVLTIPLGFPLVPQMVKYTSVLTVDRRGTCGALSVSVHRCHRKKCDGKGYSQPLDWNR